MHRKPIAQAGLTEDHLADLVERSRDGDVQAWRELWLALDPSIQRIARSWRVTSRLSRCEDAQRDIVTRVMAELRKDGFRLLGELGERLACRDGSYRRWFARVATNIALMHVRAHPDYLGTKAEASRRWAIPLPLEETLVDDRPDATTNIDAHRILTRAREELGQRQFEALCRWLQREEFDEIAVALDLEGGKEAAARLVRAAVKTLRSRHAAEGPSGESTTEATTQEKSTGAGDGSSEKSIHGQKDRTTHRQGAGGGKATVKAGTP